jgi:hypothetical protein
MTNLASQFCEALVKLKQLEELQLSRLQVSSSAAQMLAHALTELPCLNKLVLTGGAAPMHAPELYVLLNGGSMCTLLNLGTGLVLSLGTGGCAGWCSCCRCKSGAIRLCVLRHLAAGAAAMVAKQCVSEVSCWCVADPCLM